MNTPLQTFRRAFALSPAGTRPAPYQPAPIDDEPEDGPQPPPSARATPPAAELRDENQPGLLWTLNRRGQYDLHIHATAPLPKTADACREQLLLVQEALQELRDMLGVSGNGGVARYRAGTPEYDEWRERAGRALQRTERRATMLQDRINQLEGQPAPPAPKKTPGAPAPSRAPVTPAGAAKRTLESRLANQQINQTLMEEAAARKKEHIRINRLHHGVVLGVIDGNDPEQIVAALYHALTLVGGKYRGILDQEPIFQAARDLAQNYLMGGRVQQGDVDIRNPETLRWLEDNWRRNVDDPSRQALVSAALDRLLGKDAPAEVAS